MADQSTQGEEYHIDLTTPKEARAQLKADKKQFRKDQKAQRKEARMRARELSKKEAEIEGEEGGGLASLFLTLLIVLMWLVIMGLLIKLDVGGFGSTILTPILKDVPYINRILPGMPAQTDTAAPEPSASAEGETDAETAETGAVIINDNQTGGSGDAYLRQLETQLQETQALNSEYRTTIDQLQAEVERLRPFEEQQAELETKRLQFYEDVVFNDNAPDVSNYISYYEMIEPDAAALLYSQAVRSQIEDEQVRQYAASYSAMKPKQAAAIFDEMVSTGTEHDVQLAARILLQMSSGDRGKIMAQMSAENASVVTDLMEPNALPYPDTAYGG